MSVKNRTGMKRTGKVLIVIALLIAMTCMFAGCGKHTLHIKVIDKQSNAFVFVDSATGDEVAYDTLILDGKEVVDYQCSDVQGQGSVTFATEEGQIVREEIEEDGRTAIRTSFNGCQGYTEAAEFLYELDNGVLTITVKK